ncbi:SLATT domain-containing protein [Nonomuraea sp. B10E15]|uniref:SLATT domain-containing protein n=1 Tax=Nonomuraea sp. B10E15 TaxID=3153560 RepID=UPI00325E7FC2
MARAARNLIPSALAELPQGDPVETASVLFRHAERNSLTAIDWYLWKKTIKSRWSRGLRATAIVLAVCGGVVPLVHAADNRLIAPEWGYVLLALSAGCVLLDRYFGFTTSWMRYMRAQARLHRALLLAQADWTAAMCRSADGETLMTVIRELIQATGEVLENETDEWASELNEQAERLQQGHAADRPAQGA